MLEKSSQFWTSEQPCDWAEKLGRFLEYCRSWNNTLGKLVVVVNPEATWFEFWMKGALVTVEIFVFCGWRFSNQFDVVSEKHFSYHTVGSCELWLFLFCSLLCPETDWAEKLGRFLECCRSWNNTLGKLVVVVNPEATWFEFWMKGALVTVEIFVFCGWRFSNQFDVVSEKHFSYHTVGSCELWLFLFCSLLCPETDWAEKLGRFLECCRSWNNTLGKLVVVVNPEAIWFEFWMKGALVTVEIFVFCSWRFSNQFDIVSEKHFSYHTVGCELWLAIFCSLLCPETDWIRTFASGSKCGEQVRSPHCRCSLPEF